MNGQMLRNSCTPPQDPRPIVSVLGTFVRSPTGYHSLHVDTPEVLFRRVLRVPDCTDTYEPDILAVPDHNMSRMSLSTRAQRAIGPIVSLYEWLARALVIWPNARFISKVDDDAIVLDPPLFAALLRSLPSHSLWGRIERYEFNTTRMAPHRFHSKRHCTSASSDQFGFPFPKGFLFALSRSAAADVLSNASYMTRRVFQVWSNPPTGRLLPYEDVVVGFSLKRHTARDLHVVDAAVALLGEGIWRGYTGLLPCSVALHIRQRRNMAAHMRRMIAWKRSHPCKLAWNASLKRFGKEPACSGNASVIDLRYSLSTPTASSMAEFDDV